MLKLLYKKISEREDFEVSIKEIEEHEKLKLEFKKNEEKAKTTIKRLDMENKK